jgi:transposase
MKESPMAKILYVGMDVHQACIVIAVIDAKGKTVSEAVIETKTETVKDFIRGIKGELHVTFEEGTQATWLYDLLRPLVTEVVVCNPRHNKLLASGNKNDKIDAAKLAQLLRGGLLKAVYHGEAGTRALKELVRCYEYLLSDTTRVMNRLKALYRGWGVTCAGHDVYRKDKESEWLAKLADRGVRQRAQLLYRELRALKELRQEAKQAMLAESRKHSARKILEGVPMLGAVRVAQIIATVDNPHRFRGKRQFWAYCGLAVVQRTSAEYRMENGKVKKSAKAQATRGLNTNHNRRLKHVFKAAATSACGCEPFKKQYEKLVEEGVAPALARLTITRKLAAITLAMWKQGEPFAAERAMSRAA